MVIEDLQAFVLVARTGSFSRAAMRLRLAQSSLSKRVQRLETTFGVPLFQRHGRGVSLTEAGSILLQRADRLMCEVESLQADVRSTHSEPVGTVRIAMPPATSEVLGPRIYSACRDRLPQVVLHMRENTSDNIHDWIAAAEVDLALQYNPEESADFIVQPLLAEPLFLIAPVGGPVDYPDKVGFDDLARLPLILPRATHSIRVLVERLCANSAVRLRVVSESDSIRATKGIVEAGHGCTIFSRGAVAEELAQGRLRAIAFRSPLASWSLCLVSPRRDPVSLAVMAVRHVVMQQVRALLHEGFWPGGRSLVVS